MICVIGSGPTGVACAHALVQRGLDITMLDVGLDLEEDRRQRVRLLGSMEPEHWDLGEIARLKGVYSTVRGIPNKKLIYGSDYPYRDAEDDIVLDSTGVTCHPSYARGGLGAVWGSVVLPYLPQDIADWPIRNSDLTPHYEAVLGLTGLAAVDDDLAELFPLYCDHHPPLRPSAQASILLNQMAVHRPELRARGFVFGRSRLATRANGSSHQHPCVYCGLCLHGCPYQLIYNPAQTIEELKHHKNFHYVDNVLVRKLEESAHGVRILGQTYSDQSDVTLDVERVYVACGVFSTTRIMLETMGAYEEPVHLLDSQYFFLPMLQHRATKSARNEALQTLSQVTIELFDPEIGEHPVHMQLSTYNDHYVTALQRMFGPIFPALTPVVNTLLDRLVVLQGFIHSSRSSTATIRLHKQGNKSQLVMNAIANPETGRTIRWTIWRLIQNQIRLGMTPMVPFLKVGPIGIGHHIGGTFPMRDSPGRMETDRLGRPYGYRRVHLVDSSIFPSLAATLITLPAMANAHRIGSAIVE